MKPSTFKIVYIPMCADIIHSGHINIIKRGHELGQVTIGLLSDDAVIGCKGMLAVPYRERLAVLENIRGVGFVIEQTSEDMRPNLRVLKPDYVVHGDDWVKVGRGRGQTLETINEWGGQLIEPAYSKGVSSSLLRVGLLAQHDKNKIQ